MICMALNTFKTKSDFERIFKELYPVAVVYARKFVYDLDASQDIAQQVFIKIYEKRDSLEINTSIKSYVFQAVRNSSINYLKQKQTQQKHASFIKERLDVSNNTDTLVASEFEQQVFGLINQLPDRCQQVFKMNRFEGKKNKEIAQDLNISIRTVETQISKALKFLRQNISRNSLLAVLVIQAFFHILIGK